MSVSEFLEDINIKDEFLEKYTKVLNDIGLEDMNDMDSLREVTVEDLIDGGVKKIHAKKIFTKIQEKLGIQPPHLGGPLPHGGGGGTRSQTPPMPPVPDVAPPVKVVPLFYPNNLSYDNDSGNFTILPDKVRNGLVVNEQALDFIRRIKKKIGVVSICGKARTGKSLIAGELVCPQGRPCPFDLGHLQQACTYGIWLGLQTVPHPTDDDAVILVLDVEGTDFHEADPKNDYQLMIAALMVSSCLIYNIQKTFGRSALDEIEFITELTSKIACRDGKQDSEDDAEMLRRFFPVFLWLVRDSHLDFRVNENIRTLKDYFHQYILQPDAKPKGYSRKERNVENIKRAFLDFFPRYNCYELPPPSANQKMYKFLGTHPLNLINPDFAQKVQNVVNSIIGEVPIKYLITDFENDIDAPCRGENFVEYIRTVVEGVNSGVPNVESIGQTIFKNQIDESFQKSCSEYRRLMRERLAQLRDGNNESYPLCEGDIKRVHNETIHEILSMDGVGNALMSNDRGALRDYCLNRLFQFYELAGHSEFDSLDEAEGAATFSEVTEKDSDEMKESAGPGEGEQNHDGPQETKDKEKEKDKEGETKGGSVVGEKRGVPSSVGGGNMESEKMNMNMKKQNEGGVKLRDRDAYKCKGKGFLQETIEANHVLCRDFCEEFIREEFRPIRESANLERVTNEMQDLIVKKYKAMQQEYDKLHVYNEMWHRKVWKDFNTNEWPQYRSVLGSMLKQEMARQEMEREQKATKDQLNRVEQQRTQDKQEFERQKRDLENRMQNTKNEFENKLRQQKDTMERTYQERLTTQKKALEAQIASMKEANEATAKQLRDAEWINNLTSKQRDIWICAKNGGWNAEYLAKNCPHLGQDFYVVISDDIVGSYARYSCEPDVDYFHIYNWTLKKDIYCYKVISSRNGDNDAMNRLVRAVEWGRPNGSRNDTYYHATELRDEVFKHVYPHIWMTVHKFGSYSEYCPPKMSIKWKSFNGYWLNVFYLI